MMNKRLWVVLLLILVAGIVSISAHRPLSAAAGPDFRIIGVTAEYGQLIVEVQHFHTDGSPWFFEDYTFQGREAFKFPILRDTGKRSANPHLDQGSILRTIRSIHRQRLATGWTKGAQRLTTTPLDATFTDLFGAPLLADRFKTLVDKSFSIASAQVLSRYTGPVPPADMTVGPESGTVSTFFPDSHIESTSTDGEVWMDPDSNTFFIAENQDNVNHNTSHTVSGSLVGVGRSGAQTIQSWVRYNNVDIPNAATITSALLTITAAATNNRTSVSNIYAEDSDDAPVVNDDTGWHNQVLTTAFAVYDGPHQWTINEYEQLTDMSTVVQEVVDRGGWSSGADMAFYWLDDGSAPSSFQHAISLSGESSSSSARAPRFFVEWTDSNPGDSWANLQGGIGRNFLDSTETATTQIAATTTTDQWQNIGRSIFLFDTSALPDTDHISSATFDFVATSKIDGLTESISLVTSAPASDTELAVGDFDSFGTTQQATDLTIASLTADSSTFNTFTLTETGEGNISKTTTTTLGTMLASDRTNSEPTWSSGATSKVAMATSEETLSGDKRPTLTVTHNASGASGGTTVTSGTRTSVAIDLSGVTQLAYCAIGWEASVPPGTTVSVSTSVAGLAGPFTASTNGSCPAGLTIGESLASITDFRTRVTLTTTDDTITPLVTALGLIVEDEAGQDVYYQLITTPSATVTDRSGSGNTGTMSFPVAPSDVVSTTDPIVSTRTQLTFERAITVPAVVSAVTGSATADNLFGDETGYIGLPGFGIVKAIADSSDTPIRFIWFIFLGLFIIGSGAGVLMLTHSMVMAAAAMAAAMGLAGAIGSGLMPLWMIFVFVPMAGVLILVRPGKLAT